MATGIVGDRLLLWVCDIPDGLVEKEEAEFIQKNSFIREMKKEDL